MVKQSVKQVYANSMDLASVISEAMFDKRASKVIVMDMRNISGASFDVFVICEAVSAIQVKAIADGVEEQVFKQLHEHPLHIEGFINAEWILLDYGNVVVHVFQERIRAHIKLEELWSDAKTTEMQEKQSIIPPKPAIIKKPAISKKPAVAKKPATKTKLATPKSSTTKKPVARKSTKTTKTTKAKKPAYAK